MVKITGGEGGTDFIYHHDGATIKKVEVWAGGSTLNGIRIHLSKGLSMVFGAPDRGLYKEYNFEDGEVITSMSLWSSWKGTRCGGIKFKTSKGGNFYIAMSHPNLGREEVIDVASGVPVGVAGRAGGAIHAIGFIFLK